MVKEIDPIFTMIEQNYKITGLYRIMQQFWLSHNQYYLSTYDESNSDTTIYNAEDVNGGTEINLKKFYLRLKNTGHTQSLFILNNPNDKKDYLFTGTYWQTEWHKQNKTKIKWTIDISLIPTNLKQNTLIKKEWDKYPKIIGLQSLITSEKLIKRAEFAITPNQKYLLIAVNDSQDNVYFAIYAITDIWQGLKNNSILDISTIKPLKKVTALKDKWDAIQKKLGSAGQFSFQGFGIDNGGDIYISSQLAPDLNKTTGKVTTYPRCIVKITNFSSNLDDWTLLNLTDKSTFDQKNLYTEFENMQVNSANDLNFIVGYHKSQKINHKPEKNNKTDKYKLVTVENKIYYLSWFEL